MKTIIQLAFIGALLLSCKKNNSNNTNNQTPSQQNPPPNNSFPTSFKTADIGYRAFDVYGAGWNHVDWGAQQHQYIYTQNNITWIDSMNYVIREPLPITIVDATHITFNTYTLTVYPYTIVSGSGVLTGDTMITQVNAQNGNNQPFTFKGKYRKLP